MVDTMKKWMVNANEAEKNLDEFTAELLDYLEEDQAKPGSDAEALIKAGYGFLDEPSNEITNISKDLWKGYALGFMRGWIQEALEKDSDEEDE